MQLVTLAALKLALGVTGSAEDTALTNAEARAAAWVEKQTGRRFQTPAARTEYANGSGSDVLYLDGHIDDPMGVVVVTERQPPSDPVAFTAFSRRGNTVLRTDSSPWIRPYEYALTYDDGYTVPPLDIQQLVIEIVGKTRSLARGDIKSETIGEYSYTIDSSVTAMSLALTDTGSATLASCRRRRF